MKLKTFITRVILWSALVLAGVQLSGCSRTVTWEEEVPLNTGETIWVKRITKKELQSAAGNPLDISMQTKWTETLEFTYLGGRYEYTGDAQLIVLAISPKGIPTLFAPASNKNWDYSNNYKCTRPYYVQLNPDSSGKNWTWPAEVEDWAYGLPANLMVQRGKGLEVSERITTADRDRMDKSVRMGWSPIQKIQPDYLSDRCKREFKNGKQD